MVAVAAAPTREDFASMLEESFHKGNLEEGSVIKGTVVGIEKDLAVIDVGLDYHVGTAGSRLSQAQRQRAAITRALLKRPDLLILNEATSALDAPAQVKVMAGLREEMAGRGLIWVLHRASLARQFDRVLVMSGGKLQEQGRFEELDRKDSLTALLMAAE